MATIMSIWYDDSNCLYYLEIRYFQSIESLPSIVLKKIIQLHGNLIRESNEICETDRIDEISIELVKEKFIINQKNNLNKLNIPIYNCKFFYSVYTKVIYPLDISIECLKRSKNLYSKRYQNYNYNLQEKETNSDLHDMNNIKNIIDKMEKICQLLQLSNIPRETIGRENEKNIILDQIKKAIFTSGNINPIYISGVPGIGKTLTVMEVLRLLQNDTNIPTFKSLVINGMLLRKPEECYNLIYNATIRPNEKKMKCLSTSKLINLLEQEFIHNTNRTRPPLILVIDEMDLMLSNKNLLLYNLLDWQMYDDSRLIIIGLANTMDLPEKLSAKIRSRLGENRIVFPTYTTEQIKNIIKNRLDTKNYNFLSHFSPNVIQIIAKSVSYQSGDIRRALHIAENTTRAAIERISHSNNNNINENIILLKDYNVAKDQQQISPVFSRIENCRTYESIFLAALYYHFNNDQGTGKIELNDILYRFEMLCTTKGLQPKLNLKEIIEIGYELKRAKIINFHVIKGERGYMIQLKVSCKEIFDAFGNHPTGRDLVG